MRNIERKRYSIYNISVYKMKFTCAKCQIHACNQKNWEKAPKNCASLSADREFESLYLEEENYKVAQVAAQIVMDNYGAKTRIVEIIDFAKGCGYQKLGLAFCIGLSKEAAIIEKILLNHGFDVESIVCKVGGVSRKLIGIENCETPMCNPIIQAQYLNKKETELNILVGLCVGHDSLFFKYSNALVTVFAVKDRVLAHNSMGAIYQASAYYEDKLFKKQDK